MSSASAVKRKLFENIPRASRPYMPGYGLPSGEKGLLPWRWAERRLLDSHNYWLVTTRPEGAPHAMLVWGIWFENKFYFSTGRKSRKARNLFANPHCVVGTERSREAVIVEGLAREVKDVALIRRLGSPYQKKYPPWKLEPKLGPIFEVHPRLVFGLDEKRTLHSATRWKFATA